MDASSGSLRRNALARLASLATTTPSTTKNDSFDRLVQSLPPTHQSSSYLDGVLRAIAPSSRLQMNIRELDVLLALCATAQHLKDIGHAERLARQLGDYLPEAHTQLLVPSPYLQEIKPSPWAVLTQQLTDALLVLGLNFPSLRPLVKGKVTSYINNWVSASTVLASAITSEDDTESNEQEAVETAAIAVSMVGFLQAAARHENVWTPEERLQLIKSVKGALSERFLIALEKATSIIRHSTWSDAILRDWKKSLKHYAASGSPLGAMLLQKGFMGLVLACTSRLLGSEEDVGKPDLLEQYANGVHLDPQLDESIDDSMIEYLTETVTDQMTILEDGSDYLQLSSSWQQRLAFSVKAYALEAFVHCMVVDEDIADAEVLLAWLEDSIESQPQMADPQLAGVVLRSLTVVAKHMPEGSTNFARILLRFVVQGTSQASAVDIAAGTLAQILRMLSQDAIITTLYSLGNVLSSQTGAERQHQAALPVPDTNGHHNSLSSSSNKIRTGSVISLSLSGDEETCLVCGNVARAIVKVAVSCNDPKIITLAQTMMIQKMGRINVMVDAHIVNQAARLAVHGKENELRFFLRLCSRLHQDAVKQKSNIVFDAVQRARQYLAVNIDTKSPLFRVFAIHLLERILSKGDVVEGEFKHSAEVEQAAQEIAPLLKPLAILASRYNQSTSEFTAEDSAEIESLAREAWYNIAVHGITLQSRIGQQYYEELRLLAMYSEPLLHAERAELMESDVELNTVLRRGMSSQHVAEQKKNLISVIPERESDIRHLSYQKVVFLNAVYLVESLRATSGNCSDVLVYFTDPSLQSSHMGACLTSIADAVVKIYVQKARPAKDDDYAATFVARQLVKILTACCHRSAKMQEVARSAADQIINLAPSSLCQKSSVFALLELLTLMWSSCLEAEIDEYDWRPTFTSVRGKVTIELSDDYASRKRTLDLLYTEARKWMTSVIALAPLDVKGLLQTYLSEFDDTGSYGHISLGRSFAIEMGSMIPAMDHRLGAIDRQRQTNVNVASDFIAQYTTRQEYRFAGAPHEERLAGMNGTAVTTQDDTYAITTKSAIAESINEEARAMLAEIESRRVHQSVPLVELQDVLRRAAALLCRSKGPQTAIVRYLVQIPFELFHKDSIKMGISLWLGVIHENSRMESRILTEVAQAWEKTIDRRVGIFNSRFHHSDPFYVKMEFAPSDRDALRRQAQTAQSTISPHLRVLQFFESHFNAIRLGSPNTQRTIVRMIDRTLEGFLHIKGHPLLREMHFHVVLFSLRVLQYSTCLNKTTMWRLKDKIITAALRWFVSPPYWSFGGNRLQVKAEVKVMQEVLGMLSISRHVVSASNVSQKRDPQNKQELLELLLHSEINRLQAWLQPVGYQGTHAVNDAQIASFARAAWTEDPALAVQLLARFPSPQLHKDTRFLLCNFPDKALHEADAVNVLLGDALPTDLSFQLKYLLLWDAVNPMQAVTYFMPAYGNHPFVLQYAMRALESHSVDVTFFYVPQIVQCLRYDALGYVERYIVETGKVSQLFAHQIIWNMKANAYKDDDSTIPDPVKPVLDQVMEKMISSFSGEDKDFYEREFAFFGEVTDISGKLKPFIKKSKPEKKAKIEEELRKIKVEVGVYLPSNPDGVVVGIDRKSGKPLQSHAKAPYMATFRIKKQRDPTNEEVSKMVEDAPKHQVARPRTHKKNSSSEISTTGPLADGSTYEVWQSAIFKVGDDCRQDVLALQMVSAFRGIFNSVGLDVYVFPYRVTATAPGCGVIDVLPNSISRDMLGREAVNGLYDYFVTKYGGEHSVRYQEARSEFVKSMAAYSVVSYLLQFKDRHNGNIMIDDKGHILHIDFGFCFDIAPGGVKFERAPFKLTPEMLAVMGGDDPRTSQAYRWFEELTIKAFLASRQYCDKLCHLVTLMLDSGLPCFKPETMQNFRNRFVLEKNEKEAAEYMLQCIKKSAANFTTKVYDEFQLITNGIPY